MRTAAPLLLLPLFAASLLAGEDKEVAAPEDPRVMGPGKAPTPFTAEAIQGACPDGRVTLLSMKSAGGLTYTRTFFGKSTKESTQVKTDMLDKNRKLTKPGVERTVAWRDLQAHASFDKGSTTITEESLETSCGTLDCLVYVVAKGTAVYRVHFAKHLPGPPVRMVVEEGDKVVQTMELVEHRWFDYEKVFGDQTVREAQKTLGDWRPTASIKSRQENGRQTLVVSVTGTGLPPSCRLQVTAGPLEGAVLTVSSKHDSGSLRLKQEMPEGAFLPPQDVPVRVIG